MMSAWPSHAGVSLVSSTNSSTMQPACGEPLPGWTETDASFCTSEPSSYGWLYRNRSLVQALLVALVVSIATRIYTGLERSSSRKENAVRRPPTAPYWAPVLGHALQMAIGVENLLKSLSRKYKDGIFTINVFGTRIHYLYDPEMIHAFQHVGVAQASFESIQWRTTVNAFGFPKADLEIFKGKKFSAEWQACYKHMSSDPGYSRMVRTTLGNAKQNIPDLVTGNESEVDQLPWERVSRVDVKGDAIEADFFNLIRDFVAHTAVPSIMGSNFLENYPNYLTDLWNFDRGFLILVTGLPRWVPIPSLTRAHIAQRNILQYFEGFHEALEKEANGENPGATWANLDDVGHVIKARVQVYRKYNVSMRGRAALDSTLLWAANANSNFLVFWMLHHIYSDKSLLQAVRQEVAPAVVVTQPKQELAFPEPPRFDKLDVERLCSHSPVIKSVYLECLRVHSCGQSPKIMEQNIVLRAREKDSKGWFLDKGHWCFAAYGLHQSHPQYFENPTEFRLDRHITTNEKGERVARNDSMTPFGGGPSLCKGKAFAERKILAITAAIVSLWDIFPADTPSTTSDGEAAWETPTHRIGTAVYSVQKDTRVRLRRRRIAPNEGVKRAIKE